MKIKSLIVGLGQIGLGYDFNDLTDGFVASHAKALHLHPDFDLIGAVDPVADRREMFAQRYGKGTYANVARALEHCRPELVVLATPIKDHVETFHELLKFPSLQLILCEKPLAMVLSDAERMLESANEKNIAVAINYVRRYDPGVQSLTQRLCAGEMGFPLKACVWFGKGIFNNGSHFVNLFVDILGQIKEVKILSPGRLWDGWDPEPDFRLVFDSGVVYFISVREEDFSYSQIEILGPKGKILFDKEGRILWCGAAPDPVFDGYMTLRQVADEIPTDMNRYQYNVLQNLADFLSGRARLVCDGESGLRTMRALDSIQGALE